MKNTARGDAQPYGFYEIVVAVAVAVAVLAGFKLLAAAFSQPG